MRERHAIADLSRDIGETIRTLLGSSNKAATETTAQQLTRLQLSFKTVSNFCLSDSEKKELMPQIMAAHLCSYGHKEQLEILKRLGTLRQANPKPHMVAEFENAVKSECARIILARIFHSASNNEFNQAFSKEATDVLEACGGLESDEIQKQFSVFWDDASLPKRIALLEASIGNDAIFAKCESSLARSLAKNPATAHWWKQAEEQAEYGFSKALVTRLKKRQQLIETKFHEDCAHPENLCDEQLNDMQILGSTAFPDSISYEKIFLEVVRRNPVRAKEQAFMPTPATRKTLIGDFCYGSCMRSYDGLLRLKRYVLQQKLVSKEAKANSIIHDLFSELAEDEEENLRSAPCIERLVALRIAVETEKSRDAKGVIRLIDCLFEKLQVSWNDVSNPVKPSLTVLRNSVRAVKFLRSLLHAHDNQDNKQPSAKDFGKEWLSSFNERAGTIVAAPQNAMELEESHSSFVKDVTRNAEIFIGGKPLLYFKDDNEAITVRFAHREILSLTKENYEQAGALMAVLNQSVGNAFVAALQEVPILKLPYVEMEGAKECDMNSSDEPSIESSGGSALFPFGSDIVFNVFPLEGGCISVMCAVYSESLKNMHDKSGSLISFDEEVSSFFVEGEFLIDQKGRISFSALRKCEFKAEIQPN